MGQSEQTLIRQAMRENRPLPDRIQNAPSFLPGLELYYTAFMDLMGSRQIGGMGGIGPIGWDVVQRWAQYSGLDADQTQALHHHIGAMDHHYMAHYMKKNS